MVAWTELTTKPYADQCKWFLNGFWEEVQGNAEHVWNFWQKFAELDQEKKASGCYLDEFWSHKFLETLGETLTVIALREKLRMIDVDNNKKMSITEYLMFRYSKSVDQVLNAPQGENKEELEKAQAMVDAAQNAVADMLQRLEEQKAAVQQAQSSAAEAKAQEAAAKAAEADAKARAADAQTKEAESKRTAEESTVAAAAAEKAAAASRAAADESQAALAELQAQETAYEKKKADLLQASQTGGVVQRNKAANELEQLKSEDPLPLRRAKINQTAAVKKAERAAAASAEAATKAAHAADDAAKAAEQAEAARKDAEEAATKAENAAHKAEEARKVAESKQAEAEEAERQVASAVAEAEQKLEDAVQFLAAVKAKGGIAHGAIWWMEREIAEKRKYLPKRLQN
eukprot:TRINITY_DN135_c1_g1_i1.p1 TRINITY_DN135_c1_g1~~TRINITY_DN135_c1_g1_i1.p1  ORF type:complete len:430 (+),score=164.28 TRINITY_DN135_c1_g1_i1:87-1292(+)